ncbi:PREDICTED: atherin-like [Cercocebus atys]|uniref:atherin-like n=1 Tax=Cercocebus atys TaxID=9531 RepID=UPI0005F3A453|nr:PREDICTED: atherin-like [Cercocebus atys]
MPLHSSLGQRALGADFLGRAVPRCGSGSPARLPLCPGSPRGGARRGGASPAAPASLPDLPDAFPGKPTAPLEDRPPSPGPTSQNLLRVTSPGEPRAPSLAATAGTLASVCPAAGPRRGKYTFLPVRPPPAARSPRTACSHFQSDNRDAENNN